ncbi:hypothetical protein Tco_0096602 [Tanacetum coccineum]
MEPAAAAVVKLKSFQAKPETFQEFGQGLKWACLDAETGAKVGAEMGVFGRQNRQAIGHNQLATSIAELVKTSLEYQYQGIKMVMETCIKKMIRSTEVQTSTLELFKSIERYIIRQELPFLYERIDSIKNLLDRFSSSKPLSPPIPKYQISVCLLFSKPDVRNGMVKSESVQLLSADYTV